MRETALYPPKNCDTQVGGSQEDSIRSRIERNKYALAQQLKICIKALAALDANPELAATLELVRQAQ